MVNYTACYSKSAESVSPLQTATHNFSKVNGVLNRSDYLHCLQLQAKRRMRYRTANKFVKALFCLVVLLSLSKLSAAQEDSTKTRSFEQTFQIEPEALFDVNLRYARMKIVNWDSSAVSINGEVEALTSDSAEAERIFNLITIDMYSSPLEVGLTSTVDATYEEREKQPFRITFVVKLPHTVGVLGRFDFCEIDIPKLSGPTDLKYNYTNLKADSLNFEKTEVAGKYSTTEISHFSGNMLASQYGTLKVGNITDSTEVINEYGTAELSSISESCKWLKLINDFGDIDIQLSDTVSYQFKVDSNYGSLIFPEETQDIPETDPSKETEWQASIGKGEKETAIEVINEFGTISFSW